MFPTRFHQRPTLSFVGLSLPYTMGQSALSEMQSRYTVKVFKGEVKLPSFKDMQQEVTTRKDAHYKQFQDPVPFIVSQMLCKEIRSAREASFFGVSLFCQPPTTRHLGLLPLEPC